MKKRLTPEEIPELPFDTLLTEREVARQLNVSIGTLRRWRLLRQGPPFTKLGALVRYNPTLVRQWVATRPVGGTQMNETPRSA